MFVEIGHEGVVRADIPWPKILLAKLYAIEPSFGQSGLVEGQ
jgi:hypothetical protein